SSLLLRNNMRSVFKVAIGILFVSLISGCALFSLRPGWKLVEKSQKKKPSWVTKEKKATDLYHYFSGMRTEARRLEDGESDAVKNAARKIVEYFGQEGIILYEKKRTEIETELLDQVKFKGSAAIRAAKLQEMYYEKWQSTTKDRVQFSYDVYVLIRYPIKELEKEKAAQRKKAIELTRGALALSQSARSAWREGRVRESILQYAKALGFLSRVSILVEISPVINNETLKAEIRSDLEGITSKIKTKGTGSGQEVIVKRPLKESLTLKVSYEEKEKSIPVKSLPISFEFVKGEGSLKTLARTNNNGVANCRVWRVDSSFKPNVVEGGIDVRRLLGKKKDEEIDKTLLKLASLKERYTFNSYLPREKKVFLVRVIERNLKEKVTPSLVQGEIEGGLIDDDYQLKRKGEITDRQAREILKGNKTLMQNLGRELGFDVLVIGQARTEYMGSTIPMRGKEMEFAPCCRANVSMKVMEAQSGRIIASVSEGRVKEFGRTRQEAGEKALKKAGKKISQSLLNQLDSLF
ncbi:hypothetical protein KAT51_03060, partial [bacterium]|nr:hypothetical protein [bacterium]